MADQAALGRKDASRLELHADVLDVLIRLFDRELDADYLVGFQAHDLAGWIGSELGQVATQARALGAAVVELPAPLTTDVLDELAAEYADLMLTNGYRVSPSASVWLTEDHLERQLPMFDVREWYDHYDISVPDWRCRADDHLVHLLQFLGFLCRGATASSAGDAARFMDAHVLSWVPEFCRQAQPHLRAPIYQSAVDLLASVLEDLRGDLQDITGVEREERLAAPPKSSRTYEEDAPYMPGLAESW